MAKKARTPAPPRRVQAPRPRVDDGGGDDRRRWRILIAIAALGILGLVAAVALLAFSGGTSASAEEQLAAAGCTFNTYPAQEARHTQVPPRNFKYNSFPPTTGPHHPEPPPFSLFEEPVEQYRLLHNLEHGGVAIQYGRGVPRATIDSLLEWYRNDPNGLVIAPLPALGGRIALSAWTGDEGDERNRATERGFLAKCPRFDEGAFSAFVNAYGFKGPERFPRDLLTPGA